ncbi:MAG TPA: hypothetical protein VH041_06815 [Caldimonas sp.]|nr:hypothetical protein [Caldimonas sp.]HEX4234001.1 hypothetical protein [Caldimonas sp.]
MVGRQGTGVSVAREAGMIDSSRPREMMMSSRRSLIAAFGASLLVLQPLHSRSSGRQRRSFASASFNPARRPDRSSMPSRKG